MPTRYFCDVCDKEFVKKEDSCRVYLHSKQGWGDLNVHAELESVCVKCKKDLINGYAKVIEILKNEADLRQIYEMKCK